MSTFFRCLSADFLKTKRLSIRIAHIFIPVCTAVIFLAYYVFAPWDTYVKVEAYFQVLGIGFPFLISLFGVMLSEQEASAGAFQEMLMARKRQAPFFSKLLLLLLFGAFSVLLASVLFGTGYFYLLDKRIVDYPFYWYAPFILLGSSVFLYIWHLFLALRWNKGISIGLGMVESLLSALLLTGMGDAIWMYVPSAWSARLVTQFLRMYNRGEVFGGDGHVAVGVCILTTVIALSAFGIWSCRWEGKNGGD